MHVLKIGFGGDLLLNELRSGRSKRLATESIKEYVVKAHALGEPTLWVFESHDQFELLAKISRRKYTLSP